MNLKEHVRKVLKEEMDTKVLNLIEKIALDYVDFDVCKMVVKKIDNLKDQYLIILMTEKFLKSSYREELQNHIEELIPFTIYVSIADGLLDCKKYVKKSNSEQLSESKVPSQVLRRHNLIDNLFTTVRSRFSKRICDYRHPDHFLDTLYERVLEDLYHAWFYETVTDDEWDVASKYIEHYLTKKYKKSTVMFWENECNKKSSLRKKEETKEGLLDDLQNFFTKKKNRNTNDDIKRFTCEDCGDPGYQMYMVNDDIWNEYGNNSNTLCMGCLEKRMGRKLTKDDFSQHKDALTNQHNDEVQDILSNDVEHSSQELQERCWKGYNQKGMKTMFGKRYPNCVKKTK
jgi:hypothetical protein